MDNELNKDFFNDEFFIAKWEHLQKFFNLYGNDLRKVFTDIAETLPEKSYLIINPDEPYAEEVFNIIKAHNTKQIVAFIGRAGSGKDYQCQLLQQKEFTRIAFADALRDVTADIIRWPLHELLKIYDDFKTGDVFPGYTGRQILENVGAAVRKYDDDFWVNAALHTIKSNNYKKVCISDMRYINEYFKIQQFCNENDYEFKCVFCDYKSDRYQETNNHQSAWLSNFFATHGYKDLQEITEEDIQYALQNSSQSESIKE
jgi:hypothetical protein